MDIRSELERAVRNALEAHQREPLVIAANWKMNMTIAQGKQFLKEMDGIDTPHKLLIFPPSTALASLAFDFARNGIGYGPQNFCEKERGAFTGEISLEMIQEIGCGYALAGHSERRTYYHETDADINRKVLRALDCGMNLILCIGETISERENGSFREVLYEQLRLGLEDVETEQLDRLLIAYEPVWAIGTGKSASLEQIQETHCFLKESLVKLCGRGLKLLYGGSVNEKNAAEIGKLDGVDGFLIGSAGLHPSVFREIIKETEGIRTERSERYAASLADNQEKKEEVQAEYELVLLTEDAVKAAVLNKQKDIFIGSKCLITPLAMDCIRENQIQIRRAGDSDGNR